MRNSLRHHLNQMKPNWLFAAAKNMEKAVTSDWRAWRKHSAS
jgi:hypothetical protein